MPIDVTLPRIDVDSTTGKIARWLTKDGAAVAQGEPLFEMESDKAAVDVESPAAGIIRDIATAAGDSVPIGSVVARIFLENETYEPPKGANGGMPVAPSVDRPAPDKPAVPAPAERNPAPSAATTITAEPDRKPHRPRATPLARRLARQHGLALEHLTGSGPNGRIQQRDVLNAANNSGKRQPIVAPTGALNVSWLKTGEGTPFVLLHGFGSEIASWRPLIADDSISRPVLALDLPGHGLSALGTEASFSGLVESVETALLHLGIERGDLVGHSLGGAVAAALAASTNLSARSLTLISPAGLGPEINGAFIEGLNRANSEDSLTAWLKLTVAREEQLNPAFVKAIIRRRRETDIQQAQQRLAAALFPDSTQSFSIRSGLERLSIPVKVIFGREDRIIPAHHARGLPGTVAIHLFGNVGHMPHIEARRDVLQLLKEVAHRKE
jgi:pimeloyl-ACP methyl ester carboxylesterase